jgi:hypothetical protein
MEMKHTELSQADTLNRLTFLAQVWKDRANDESLDLYDRRRAQEPFTITVCTNGDLAVLTLSMTKAKQLIRDTWTRMNKEVERIRSDSNFVSAVPTMTLELNGYGRLWLSAWVNKEAGPELQAKWDAIEATRREQFPNLYEEE